MLLLEAERTADRPVVLLAVPEGAVVDLEVVAGPRPPAGELARRRLHGAVMAGRGILGHEIHGASPVGAAGNGSSEPTRISHKLGGTNRCRVSKAKRLPEPDMLRRCSP